MSRKQESSDDQNIVRHTEERPFEYASPAHAGGFFPEIDAHVSRLIGPIGMVIHEQVSNQVHVDVFECEPTDERPYYTYVTCGMSDRPMQVPENIQDRHRYERAELLICTPERSTPKDWPIAWLLRLARFPHVYRTWLWNRHSVPNGDPPMAFGPDTTMAGVVLGPPVTLHPEAWLLRTSAGATVCFFGVFPLYPDEMALKLAHGSDMVFERLLDAGVTELLDRNRPSVATGWSN